MSHEIINTYHLYYLPVPTSSKNKKVNNTKKKDIKSFGIVSSSCAPPTLAPRVRVLKDNIKYAHITIPD